VRLPCPDCVGTRDDKKEFVELLEFVGFVGVAASF
jgi:hypothetical protein